MLNILSSVWIEIFLEFLLCFGGILASLFARIIKKKRDKYELLCSNGV